MTDEAALEAAVRLYLPWVRGEGILTEGSVSAALIRTAYWRLKKQADAEETLIHEIDQAGTTRTKRLILATAVRRWSRGFKTWGRQ